MTIKGDKRVVIDGGKFYADSEVYVADATKILAIDGTACVVSKETLQGEVRVRYRLTSTVIYLGKDGISSEQVQTESAAVLRGSQIEQGDEVWLNLNVEGCEYVGMGNLKLRTEVYIAGFVYKQVSFEPCIPSSGIIVRDETATTEHIVPIQNSEVVINGNHQVKESIDKLITSKSSILVNKVATATETCAISGDVYTYITYVSAGNFQSRCLITPFEAEILSPGVGSSDKAYCMGNAEVTTVKHENGEVSLEIIATLGGFAVVYEEGTFISDCYSKSNELATVYDDVVFREVTCISGSAEKISGTIRLKEGDKRVRSVLAVVGASGGVANATVDGALNVEGNVKAVVIYIDEDDEVASVKVAIPYKVSPERNFPCKESLQCSAEVLCISARARHNDELDFSIELAVDVFGSSERRIKYLKSVEEIGDKESDNVAISLYFVRDGEGLWDVAKALSTDEDTILELNPELTLPIKGGDKVLLYKN